ncbi:MAG: hypothetical protein ACOC5K_04900 [Chloroflexota bacterium]
MTAITEKAPEAPGHPLGARFWNVIDAARARPILAGAAALFLLLAVVYTASMDIRASRGASITGDEPFYLLTTQSLLQDGDLDLRQQYDRRSYTSFFDHPDGLWSQSVPLEPGGELLSPHNVGLSVLAIPGFMLGGLAGAQLQLLLLSALCFALTFILAARLTGAVLASLAATAVVALSATSFIYSTEVYPEAPGALCLVLALLIVTGRSRPGLAAAVAFALAMTALVWLGVKYAPLAGLVALYFVWRAMPSARWLTVGAGAVSAAVYAWFHLETYGALTPYSVNAVYAGLSTSELVDSHWDVADQAYRLWGLFIDERFGLGRWSPALLMAVPAMALLVTRVWRGSAGVRIPRVTLPGWLGGGVNLGRGVILRLSKDDAGQQGAGGSPEDPPGESHPGSSLLESRPGLGWLLLGLVGVQMFIATFVAITMMGWWFPGRTMMTVLPLFSVLLALLLADHGWKVRGLFAALAAWSLAITLALALAGHAREVVIAVDPFDMSSPVFSLAAPLFPNYTWWDGGTLALTAGWLAVGAAAIAATVLNARRQRARSI